MKFVARPISVDQRKSCNRPTEILCTYRFSFSHGIYSYVYREYFLGKLLRLQSSKTDRNVVHDRVQSDDIIICSAAAVPLVGRSDLNSGHPLRGTFTRIYDVLVTSRGQ